MPRTMKNSGSSAVFHSTPNSLLLIVRRTLLDLVDQSLSLRRLSYREYQNTLIIDLKQLSEILRNKEVVASLDSCRC